MLLRQLNVLNSNYLIQQLHRADCDVLFPYSNVAFLHNDCSVSMLEYRLGNVSAFTALKWPRFPFQLFLIISLSYLVVIS